MEGIYATTRSSKLCCWIEVKALMEEIQLDLEEQ